MNIGWWSHVCILFFISRPDEQVVPKEDPLVHEISDVLREWNLVWKKLYAVSSTALPW